MRTVPIPNFHPVVRPSFDSGTVFERDENLLGSLKDPRELQRVLAAYYGMISHMDEWIGRIHRAVETIGQEQDTIIIHTADHGLAVGQHGLMGKQNPFEHSLRVPLIMAGPGIPRRHVSTSLCYQQDLHPTILEWVGRQENDACFQSLVPVLAGTEAGRSTITNAFADLFRATRDRRYKLIQCGRDSRLYDLQKDPWETQNRMADPALWGIRNSLQADQAIWRSNSGDRATGDEECPLSTNPSALPSEETFQRRTT